MEDYKRELAYSNGVWSVIKRESMYGTCYSVVRYGSAFFEQTFETVTAAIDWCEKRKEEELCRKVN